MTETEKEFKEIRQFLANTEERIKSYKSLLKEVHERKDIYDPLDDLTIWYKEFMREELNEDKILLKKYQNELYNYNQGLMEPFYYKYLYGDTNL